MGLLLLSISRPAGLDHVGRAGLFTDALLPCLEPFLRSLCRRLESPPSRPSKSICLLVVTAVGLPASLQTFFTIVSRETFFSKSIF